MNPDLIRQEYRQVFQADQCQLRNFDAQDFSRKMGKRKLIMVGDSIMRLNFYSLACLMKSEVSQACSPPPYSPHLQACRPAFWVDNPSMKCSILHDWHTGNHGKGDSS